MTTIITTAYEKGGSGKTTLSINLAAYLVMKNKKVIIIDADPNGTASAWVNARAIEQDAPEINLVTVPPSTPLERGRFIVDAGKKLANSKFDFVLIDSGGRDGAESRAALAIADMAIAPMAPSEMDGLCLERHAALCAEVGVHNAKLKLYALLTQTPTLPTLWREVADAREELANYQDIITLESTLTRRKAYYRGIKNGCSVFENGDPKAEQEITQLVDELTLLK